MSRPMLTPEMLSALHRTVPRRAAAVWTFLWASANKDTAIAWPSLPTIAAAVRTSSSHVSESIAALERAGWLRVVRKPGKPNRYVVGACNPTGCNQDGNTTMGGDTCNGKGPLPPTGRDPYLPREPNTERTQKEHGKSAQDGDSHSLKDLVTLWNQIEGVSHCRAATDSRKKAFHARAKNPGWLRDIPEALQRVRQSDFLRGQNDRGWRADIDWFLRPDTVTKILEGKYKNRNGPPQDAPVRIFR